jgi:hypothetical protein
MRFYYTTFTVKSDVVDALLNDIERFASERYSIVKISDPRDSISDVLIRFDVESDDANPIFDEREIRRKLGMDNE